jgi:hypothetical protein
MQVHPTSKCDKIRAAWDVGDRVGALRIAARFFDRSEETKAFKRGMDAHDNPGFYRQLAKDPDLLLGVRPQGQTARHGIPLTCTSDAT